MVQPHLIISAAVPDGSQTFPFFLSYESILREGGAKEDSGLAARLCWHPARLDSH